MIIAHGIDMVDIESTRRLLADPTGQFLARCFTVQEQQSAGDGLDQPDRLSGRFAVKEAAMKALGTGHSRGVFWRGIEVVRTSGPPQIRFHGGAAARLASLGATGSLLTITHSQDLAIAHVLLVRASA